MNGVVEGRACSNFALPPAFLPSNVPQLIRAYRQQARIHFPIGALRSRDTDRKLAYLET
jgi:hypothetical protein